MYFGITTIAWSIMTWREASLYSPPVGDHRLQSSQKEAAKMALGPAQARPSRNLLSLRPHPPTLAIIPANPPTLCPPPFKSLCQIREVMYRYTYLCVPSPFLSCSLLSLHPFMPTCQQRAAKIKALVLVLTHKSPFG